MRNQTRALNAYTVTTDYLPATWNTSFYCGVDCVAIILKYLDSYHDSNVLSVSIHGAPAIHNYLIDNGYISNTGTTTNHVVTAFSRYFSDWNLNFSASYSVYSSSTPTYLQNSFNNDFPVPLNTTDIEWTYSNHWVIAYGYYYEAMVEEKLIINDGWGRNGIYVFPFTF